MEEKEQLVLSKLDNMRDEIVGILSQLVRIPSVSPNYPELDKEKFLGGESNCNAALAEHFRGIGCEVDMLGGAATASQSGWCVERHRRWSVADI